MQKTHSSGPARACDPTLDMAITGLMAALVFTGTYFFKIPTAFGYTHLGDCMIILTVCLFGTRRGMLAGAIGAGLSDFIAGYAAWVLPTIVLKGGWALIMGLIMYRLLPHFKYSWLAGAVTGNNVLADALHQAEVRTTADTWHGMELTWSNILHFVYTTLAGKHLFWPLVLAVVLLLALFAASIRDRQQLARALPLGLCALMTPAWFIVLRTHSIQHGWFTWRALGLTVFAGLAFLYYCCDVRQIAKRLKRT